MEDAGIDVDAQDDMGCTALIFASWRGHTENVRILLQKGANVLAATKDGFTCLHMAALCGHAEIVNLLLHGKNPRECFDEWDPSMPFLSCRRRLALMDQMSSSEKFTALHLAACGEHDQGITISAALLEAYWTSALGIYGLSSNPKVAYEIENQLWLDYLLQMRNEVNLQDGEICSHTLLENLASYGKHGHSGSVLQEQLLERYEGLVRSSVDLISYSNVRDKIGRTALHYACWQNKAELVKLLLWDSQLGSVVGVNAKDVDGYTPLHFASRNGCKDVVIALLTADVVADVKNFDLSRHESQLVRKIYLRLNTAAQTTNRSRNLAADIDTPLLELDDDQYEFRSRKLQADIDRELDGPGEGQNECLSTVVSVLPRPDLQSLVWAEDRAGVTPLHYAVEKGHTDIVQLLVEHPKIEVFQRASDGNSPWTIAFPSHGKESGPNSSTDTQRLLRSGTKQCCGTDLIWRRSYRQRLVKQAAALAIVSERDNSDQSRADVVEGNNSFHSDAELSVLEKQIFVTFVEDITEGRKEILWSILDETFRVDLRVHSNWENIMDGFLSRNSDLIGSFTLLHVAAYEGFVRELETLLSVKRYKKCINDRENLTCAGHTALHFAILRCRVDTSGLALLLKEKSLRPTEMNKTGQTPLQIVEHLLDNYRLRSKLAEALKERKSAVEVTDQLGIHISRSFLEVLKEMSRLQVVQHLLGIDWLRSYTNQVKEKMITRLSKKGKEGHTHSQVVQVKSLLEAEQLLMERPEVQRSVERLYRDREVYSNAANAILVGAALIASMSYQGWVQPPQGTTGHGVYATLFGTFNSLSFSAAIAAVLTAAAAVLPSHGNSIHFQKEVVNVRRWFFVSSSLLAVSIYCIVGSTFIANVHIGQFRVLGNWTLWVGLVLVVAALEVFASRLHFSVRTRGARIAKLMAMAILGLSILMPFFL